jgi:predicted  nucleic acid-binding Zn-ribbon protein
MVDKELLTAIGETLEPIKQDVSGVRQDVAGLDRKVSGLRQDVAGLDRKVSGLDEKVTSIQKQNDIIFNEVKRLGAGHAKFSDSLFQLESDVGELKTGQMRMEDKLDCVDAMAEVTGNVHRDHETRIHALEDKITA